MRIPVTESSDAPMRYRAIAVLWLHITVLAFVLVMIERGVSTPMDEWLSRIGQVLMIKR